MLNKTIDLLHHQLAEGLHPGGQLVVWHDGHWVINYAFGHARANQPMRADTRMLWMSAGKPIGAIAIMQQIEARKATLDTRVCELLPAFAQNGKHAITIGHLLTHTAGFRGPLNSFTPGPWEAIIDRCCQLRQEPHWIPGEKAGYHIASSWFILGELVRILDGRTFDRYVREAVFAPVDADDCWIGMPESLAGENDALVEPDFAGNRVVDAWTLPRPPANARGPISGLAKVYVSLLQNDGRLLQADTVGSMIARQRQGMFDETFKQTLDWGLGFKLDSKRYQTPESYGYGPHASERTFGHSGNQCACAFADPVRRLVVAWCVNGMPGEPAHQKRQDAINEAVYNDLQQH